MQTSTCCDFGKKNIICRTKNGLWELVNLSNLEHAKAYGCHSQFIVGYTYINFCPQCGHKFCKSEKEIIVEKLDSLPNIFPLSKTICFDVDGVLCMDKYEGKVPYSQRVPYSWVSESLKKLRCKGYEVVLLTARYMKSNPSLLEEGRKELCEWLKKWNIPYDAIHMGKPSADIYVDDKAFNIKSNNGIKDWQCLVENLCKEN